MSAASAPSTSLGAATSLGATSLAAEHLVVHAGDQRLLDDVSFRLRADRLTAVLGANGAGKSILLRVLHGLIVPDGGRVTCNGRALERVDRARQAMVFQKPVLLKRSVAANIDYVLGHLPRRAERAEQRRHWLSLVGLTHRERLPARLLSGGEAQRLALARALATAPHTLFLDEPTSNLDPASTRLIERIARDIQAEGMQVVFITHDMHQARRIADDVLFLHRGRLLEHTDASRFFDQPDSETARDYLDGRILV